MTTEEKCGICHLCNCLDMGYLQDYISGIGNPALIQTINKTSTEIYAKIQSSISNLSQLNGLLLGNVQSGKTAQMLGVVSKMADEGYRLFIVLTTDNVDLYRQTYNRFRSSLPNFSVLSEKDEVEFVRVGLQKPLIVVLKKNSSVLRKWKNILVNANSCHGLYLSIFDDEADNASLNTLVNTSKVSTINKHIQAIKDTAIKTIYLEVTATPQSILLQTQKSGWKPNFVYYFKPGDGYLGGNFFYSDPKSFCAKYTNEFELDNVLSDDDLACPEGLSCSIAIFLVICAYKRLKGEVNCNYVVHPSAKIAVHDIFVKTIQDYLNLLQKSIDDDGFNELIHSAWCDLQQTKPDIFPFDDIKAQVIELLDNEEFFVCALNSKSTSIRDHNNPDALDLSKGYNIVVGGNTLGRGITFPHLQIVYYCRTSKTPQADTYWQHSRIFGYDREPELTRIFIPPTLYQLFARLNKANDILIRQIVDGINNIQIIYPQGINPTRKNVLDTNEINIISGGVNMFASYPIGINTETIDDLIGKYSTEESVVCDADLVVKLLKLLPSETSEDFDTNKYISCVESICKERPKVKCRLIVRVNRDIAKGTGTLLSQNDRELGDKHCTDIVLTLYRLIGTESKGWNGKPIWVPNIKFPSGYVYYDVKQYYYLTPSNENYSMAAEPEIEYKKQ